MAVVDINTDRLGDLASRYVKDSVRLWQRYASGLQKVTEAATSSASRAPGAAAPDLTAVGRELVQFYISHYSDLVTTYAEFTTQALASVLGAGGAAATVASQSAPAAASDPVVAVAPPPAAAPEGPKIRLTFAGSPSAIVGQSFAIANKQATAVDVSFELSEFVREGGAPRVRVPVIFSPDRFVLGPGSERVVECCVPLGSPLVPGARYMAVVRIAGFPGMDIALVAAPSAVPEAQATVTTSATPATPTSAASPAGATPKKKASARRASKARPRKRSSAG